MKLPASLRILYVSEGHRGPYQYIFANFSSAMERMGHVVARLDPETATYESYRETIDSFKPDIIFGLIRHTWAVCKIASFVNEYHPTVTVNYFQEDPNFVTAEMMNASRSFDYWFTQDARTVPFWPTKAFFMPHAFDETVYSDLSLPRVFDVSFVGQLGHASSTAMYWPYMQELAKLGRKALLCLERPMGPPLLPYYLERVLRSRRVRPVLQMLPIWRCSWENPRDEREKALVVNRSKIHFGTSRVRGEWEDGLKSLLPDYPLDKHGLFYQLKGRLFHAVGAGAMALNDYCPELENLFEIGKEIVTFEFGDLDELRDKLFWYVSHDRDRERIARAGYERGRKQHTFMARIQQMLDIISEDGQ